MTRLVIITGMENSGQRVPRSLEYATAAAVVEAACEDGKLQSPGVATHTWMRGSLGRRRRTTRLTTMLTAWAPTTVAVALSHGRRWAGSPTEPARPRAVQTRACSPRWLSITAPWRIAGEEVFAWMAIRVETSRSCSVDENHMNLLTSTAPWTAQDRDEVSRGRLEVAVGVGLHVLGEHVRLRHALARVGVCDE